MTPQMDPETIAERICQFARDNLVTEGVAFDEHSPLTEAGINSFALVELLLYCERVFGVRVPLSHLTRNNLACTATLARCVAELARGSLSPSQALA